MSDPLALNRVLSQYPPDCQPISAPIPLGNAGGLSGSRLWRFNAGRGELVLRRWPEDAPSFDHLIRIHDWLDHTARLDFVPRPIRATGGRTLVLNADRAWELTPWKPGSPALAAPPPSSVVKSAFTGLAAFHQSLAHYSAAAPVAELADRARELEHLLAHSLVEWRDVIDRAESTDKCVAPARQWIDLAQLTAPRILPTLHAAASISVPSQPCIRDCRPDHFLFEGETLTGLVDFGAMDIGSVAGDLARLLAEWLPFDSTLRSDAIEAYSALRPLAADELRLIPVYENSAAILGGSRWLRWHFLERRQFESPSAVQDGLRKSIDRLAARALR